MRLSKKAKLTAQFILGCVVTIAGLIMLFCGLFIDPKGVIDSSILVAFGESSTFAGALIGVDYNYKYKMFETRERYRYRNHSEHEDEYYEEDSQEDD